jgi:hypothetical protein
MTAKFKVVDLPPEPTCGPAFMQCAADVTPQQVEWLWPGRVALGKLTLIAGEAGLGKSQLVVLMGFASKDTGEWDFALARYKVGDCQIRWWGFLVSVNIFVHPRDIIDGPPPIPELQIVRSQQFAIPASDGEAFAGPTRPGFQAFPLTNAGGEDQQRGSLILATNVLGSPMLELLEAQEVLVPTDIEGEQVGGVPVSGSLSAPLLKCYRVKMHRRFPR